MTLLGPAAVSRPSKPRIASLDETVVAVVFALAAPVGYLGTQGVSPLVALGGLLVLGSLLRPARISAVVGVLMIFTLWAMASFFWSPLAASQLANHHSFAGVQGLIAPKLALQLLLYGAFLRAALRVNPDHTGKALNLLLLSVGATVAVLSLEALEGARLYRGLSELFRTPWPPDLAKRNVSHGCYLPAVLFWPLAALLWRNRQVGLAVLLFVAAPISCVALGEDAPAAALAISLASFGVVLWFGRLGVLACAAATVIYLVGAPLPFLSGMVGAESLPLEVGKLSWHIRLNIWRATSEKIIHKPLFGWGLDSSRAWPKEIPMHPHNGALQLWLETGAVGVGLASLFWILLYCRISAVERSDRPMAAVMSATAVVYTVIGAISFGVWQEWWLATGTLGLAACAMLAAHRRREAETRNSEGLVELELAR